MQQKQFLEEISYQYRTLRNNLIHHLKELVKEEQTKLKVGRRKEIINIREEIEIKKQ